MERMPLRELKAFKRININKGSGQTINFNIPVTELQKWDLKTNKWVLYPGDYTILIGSSSQDIKLQSAFTIKSIK